ncbi:acetyl-CoA carboxylase biotin carboxyl carrier protein [Aerococcaceae bacterium DSM 109652]|uniref:Biotin carboxyl carrier protein of acetyl-CoA carboxylase n=1 Tax=Fundicoccus ignavus TaxID=2664442 RepID=A0A844CG67_9LACT|nr:acetyl-CoA carboxylase biotin carboxyl carrier protein [Fundicoccus ignavus]
MKLIDRLETSSIRYVDYSHAGDHVVLSKEALNTSATAVNPTNVIGQAEAPTNMYVLENETKTVPSEVLTKTEVETSETTSVEVEGEAVLSPMVGVAYLQANPDAAPFVQVGDTVKQGDVIVLIEAMKLMNEIQAPKSGVITEILVDNEAVVEFNQPLIRIK